MEANPSGYVLMWELNHSVVLIEVKIWPYFVQKEKHDIYKKIAIYIWIIVAAQGQNTSDIHVLLLH